MADKRIILIAIFCLFYVVILIEVEDIFVCIVTISDMNGLVFGFVDIVSEIVPVVISLTDLIKSIPIWIPI